MLQTTWAAKNPLINLYGNVPFPPLTYKKHREAFSLTGPLLRKFVDTFSSILPPPQGSTPHILIRRTSSQLIRISPFFPSPSLPYSTPSPHSPAQTKAGLHSPCKPAFYLSCLSSAVTTTVLQIRKIYPSLFSGKLLHHRSRHRAYDPFPFQHSRPDCVPCRVGEPKYCRPWQTVRRKVLRPSVCFPIHDRSWNCRLLSYVPFLFRF